MNITGYTYDLDSLTPIPYASVQPVNANGTPSGSGVAADSKGNFSVNTETGYILITSVGYDSILYQLGCCEDIIPIPMHKKADILESVIVSAKKNPEWWILGFIGVLALTD